MNTLVHTYGLQHYFTSQKFTTDLASPLQTLYLKSTQNQMHCNVSYDLLQNTSDNYIERIKQNHTAMSKDIV